jgi:hypothetical protein
VVSPLRSAVPYIHTCKLHTELPEPLRFIILDTVVRSCPGPPINAAYSPHDGAPSRNPVSTPQTQDSPVDLESDCFTERPRCKDARKMRGPKGHRSSSSIPCEIEAQFQIHSLRSGQKAIVIRCETRLIEASTLPPAKLTPGQREELRGRNRHENQAKLRGSRGRSSASPPRRSSLALGRQLRFSKTGTTAHWLLETRSLRISPDSARSIAWTNSNLLMLRAARRLAWARPGQPLVQ